ncbi:MAG: glycosyltransferase [Candidatus Omnitrophota bacterium]
MNNPLFSVIIPAFNRAAFLKISVESVLNQTLSDFELIIIDDGSTDKTEKTIKEMKDKRIKYISQPHGGVSSARNKGLLAAKGKLISFLDSDDRFRKTKLEITYNYIQKFPQIKIFHSNEIWYRNGSILTQKEYHKKPQGDVFSQALRLCCISISAATVLKEVFDETGLFDETMEVCEDYDFWLRATAKYHVKLIPQALTLKEGGHSDQQSKRFPAMDKYRIYSINKLLQSNRLTETQREETIKELKRKCAIYINGAAKRRKFNEVKYYTELIEKLHK